ncbi:protease inhibitor I42 family protein [Candidatus Bipolaricaulota bacterium]|nr:protease inhibitor I42 family protein [Candidatus Bipolaricaulota bacterium]
MNLSDRDSNRTISVKLGDIIVLRLDENPTTGYQWEIAASGTLDVLGDRMEPGSAVGGTGMRIFEFQASTAGSHHLQLKQWRRWEGDESIIGRFECTLVVA